MTSRHTSKSKAQTGAVEPSATTTTTAATAAAAAAAATATTTSTSAITTTMLPVPTSSILSTAFRFAATCIWLLYLLFIWAFIWMRPLNPLFRKIGFHNNNLPLDLLQRTWAYLALVFAGIRVEVRGLENLSRAGQSAIFMSNHQSNIDGIAIMGHCPAAVKCIYKREIMWQFPLVGMLMYFLGHIPINRQNRESAVESLKGAAKKMSKYERSICIFPEGSRSVTGDLLPFKKGAFHMAKAAVGVPIQPVLIVGAHELWSPKVFFPPSGCITMFFLPPIANDGDKSVDELLDVVRCTMSDALEEVGADRDGKYRSLNQSGGFGPLPAVALVSVTAVLTWKVVACLLSL